MADRHALEQVRQLARPLRGEVDLDPLLERIGEARFVLLGEASHGTSEYYRWRAAVTRRLVAEHGFTFVAVEGDWPDCAEVDRWLHDAGDRRPARDVLDDFDRWPTWMWANEEVAEFLDWAKAGHPHVGFHGLDVYSLWDSLRAVLDHVTEHDPHAVEAAQQAYRCFEPYREDPHRYAWSTRAVPDGCEADVVRLLVELHCSTLDAQQNAEVVAGAERYYRTMLQGSSASWNVRDCHMVDTLDRLLDHHGPDAKAVVWEHNTHVGDARYTDMARDGMVNVGQLVRERHGDEGVALVGFGGHRGTVVVADAWGGTARVLDVPEARPDSHEDLVHQVVGDEPTLFVFPDDRSGAWLGEWRDHRAIGVVYDPRRDRWGNWVPTLLGRRYDAWISFGETSALHPLHVETPQPDAELETEPWGT